MVANRKALRWTAPLALAAALSLAACSTPPWATPSSSSATPTASVSPAQPVPNDLSTGATARSLTTGPLAVSINYWSTLSMDKWNPGALKPVSLSLITKITPNDGQKVYLQRATMIATPASATQTFDPLSPQVDSATTSPGYLVLDPYSYSQTFTVGPTPEGATYVTLDFTYEFLVQSTPTSTEYAKQTATDTITVAVTP
ncbi:hypothetical protein [Microbacterium rhizomatis]|uniref:Uncharacterized protein n=1 Tax=Microbacterium rhizomatis TaxID=1631477 RepID=A0A5J5J1B9_9MICO|nr:hypothetical protein [Microbacterium rhizomatis]KAA9107784.1 hypothetical protein F6B43_10115 [Microbacterium rhizomatis]